MLKYKINILYRIIHFRKLKIRKDTNLLWNYFLYCIVILIYIYLVKNNELNMNDFGYILPPK